MLNAQDKLKRIQQYKKLMHRLRIQYEYAICNRDEYRAEKIMKVSIRINKKICTLIMDDSKTHNKEEKSHK